MKITCSKEELSQGIHTVQTAVSSKSTLPILSNLVIETLKDKVMLMATDLEIGIRCIIKGEIEKPGCVTIPAKKFGDIVRELSDYHDIIIESDESQKVNVYSGKTRFSLKGLPKEEYPVVPEFPEEKAFSIKMSVIRNLFKKTIFAASTDTSRYVLNGIFFNTQEGKIKIVATDGKRLSLITGNGIEKSVSNGIIIPTKTANELIRLIGMEETDDNIWINITENQIAFRTQRWTLISRLVDGQYPNYEQVIPKANKIHIKLKKNDLMAVTRRAALCVVDKTGIVKYGFEKDVLKISASYQGITEFNDELECDYKGSRIDISFNPVYVLDILKSIDSDEVIFELSTALSPGLIRPENNKEHMCVVMPMKTS